MNAVDSLQATVRLLRLPATLIEPPGGDCSGAGRTDGVGGGGSGSAATGGPGRDWRDWSAWFTPPAASETMTSSLQVVHPIGVPVSRRPR